MKSCRARDQLLVDAATSHKQSRMQGSRESGHHSTGALYLWYACPTRDRKEVYHYPPKPDLVFDSIFFFLFWEGVLPYFFGCIVARFREDTALLRPAGLKDLPIHCGIADGGDGGVVVATPVFITVEEEEVVVAVPVVLFCRPDPSVTRLYT